MTKSRIVSTREVGEIQIRAAHGNGTNHQDLPSPFEVSRQGPQGQGYTDNQRALIGIQDLAGAGQPDKDAILTSEPSGTRDQTNSFYGVLPSWTSILLSRDPVCTLSPFYNFEKNTVRLDDFPSDGVGEGVIWSVSEFEESVWFPGLPKSFFESLLATERSDCFWNRSWLYVSRVLDGVDPDRWDLNLRCGRGGYGSGCRR